MAHKGTTREWILTHGAKAHRDEYLACCYVLAMSVEGPMDIVRRGFAFPYELRDPRIWVLDVGGRYEPQCHNFDHHQSNELDCTLIQVMKYFNVLDTAKQVMPWLELTALVDAHGASAGAQHLHISTFDFAKTLSPNETYDLHEFTSQEVWRANSPMVIRMLGLGRHLMNHMGAFIRRMELLRTSSKFFSLTPDDGMLQVVDVDNLTDPKLAMSTFRHEAATLGGKRIAVAASPDNYGKGWMLYDYCRNPYVDLRKLEGMPHVGHIERAYMVKLTKRLPIEELVTLVRKAVLDVPHVPLARAPWEDEEDLEQAAEDAES